MLHESQESHVLCDVTRMITACQLSCVSAISCVEWYDSWFFSLKVGAHSMLCSPLRCEHKRDGWR